MKKRKVSQLELNKSKISKLLGIDIHKVKGGDSGNSCQSCIYECDNTDDCDYSTNGCYSTWTS